MNDRSFGAVFGAAAFALLAVRCASSPPAASPAPGESPSAAASHAPGASSSPALVGEWGIQIKFFEHTVDGTLRFTREGNALVGSFTDDVGNESELEKLHVAEGKISWQMDRKDGRVSATGTIEGTIMSGKMKLKRPEGDARSGFGIGPGGLPTAGRRMGEPDSFGWTAAKRAETPPPPK
jgi:hypothetical protein